MPSEQIINVTVTKADRFASMTTRHQNLRKSLYSVMPSCFKSKQLVTALMVSIFHVPWGTKNYFLSFIHVTSDFSLPPVAVYCSFVTGLTVMIRPQRLNGNYDLIRSFGFCRLLFRPALSSRHTFALQQT